MGSGKEDLEALLQGTPYRALRVMGRGGMGLVVEAERTDIGRRVAVKVLHAELARDENIVDRLRIEAQTLGRITSPHVVQVLDLGRTAAGRPYLAMERLEGRTLRDELKEHRTLDPRRALDIADQALRGLGEAHALGVVHRDVKPENLFLTTERGRLVVKVLDFGVAKVVRPGGGVAPPTIPTEEGLTVGTPRYLAPEQVLGSAGVDHRIDLYAVGLLLWSMLVGKLPFEELVDAVDLAKRQLHGANLPPPSTLVAGLPAAFDALIARATAKSRDDRFPDAEAFRRALEGAAAALDERGAAAAKPRQLVTMAMETLDPATLAESTSDGPTVASATLGEDVAEAPTVASAGIDPSTLEGETRDAPPEVPTVALATLEPTRQPTTRRAEPRTLAMQQLAVPQQPVPRQPVPQLSPTPPPTVATVPLAAGGDEPSSWVTFALVVVVTVLVLGAIGAAMLFFGLGGISSHHGPGCSVAGERA